MIKSGVGSFPVANFAYSSYEIVTGEAPLLQAPVLGMPSATICHPYAALRALVHNPVGGRADVAVVLDYHPRI